MKWTKCSKQMPKDIDKGTWYLVKSKNSLGAQPYYCMQLSFNEIDGKYYFSIEGTLISNECLDSWVKITNDNQPN